MSDMMPFIQTVGTVELLHTRVYPLDAYSTDRERTEVIVQPGLFDLIRYYNTYFWMMNGTLDTHGFDKIGDGLFVFRAADGDIGITVTFPSYRYGREQLADLMAEPICEEGAATQRLRIHLLNTDAFVIGPSLH